LSRFGLLGLWTIITLCSDLRLGWGLKQTCSSPWELSNGRSHSTYTHWGQVNSQLLMVGNQIVSLTPAPSFCHNLWCRCPMANARTISTFTLQWLSNDIKNTPMQSVWPLKLTSEVSGVPEDSQVPISRVWVSSSHFLQSRVATPNHLPRLSC